MDGSGVIIESGSNVTSVAVGDEVYFHTGPEVGVMAEYIAIHENKVAPKPQGLTHIEAASLPVAGLTSLQALLDHGKLRTWSLERKPRVLILGGTSATGMLGIQLAHAIGAEVVTTCSPRNFDWVKELGADETIDYHTQDIAKVLEGETIDVIYDCIGGGDSWLAAQRILSTSGQYVTIVGDEADHHMTITTLLTKGWQISSRFIGYYLGSNPRYTLFLAASGRKSFDELNTIIAKGQLKPIIDTVYPIEQFAQAFSKSISGRARGKLVLTFQD